MIESIAEEQRMYMVNTAVVNKVSSKTLDYEVKNNYGGNYIDYAMDKSQYLILNESKNIVKQILMSFMVATKVKSLLNNIHGGADTGKSYIFEVVLHYYIPEEYIEEINDSTEAAFINNCKKNPYYYDGKIIYFGDLGDKDKYLRMKSVFDIIKIIISEGKYRKSKNDQAKGEKWDPIIIEIIGTLGAFYCTVYEDNEDKTNQINSRTIFSTPALNNKNKKIKFKENVKTIGTVENAKFKKTVEELKSFKSYFKESVEEYIQKKYQVINPFYMVFNNITEYSATETRELENINEMFKAYCFLNRNICFQYEKKVDNETIRYIIPKIEEVQKFINVIYSSVGLKPYERNLLLKLKKEFNSLTEDKADKIYNKIEENHKKSMDQIKDTYKELFSNHGIKTKDKCFFRTSDIKTKYKNHKAIKDIESLRHTLVDLANRGFLGKLENKYNRANVYFLNEDSIANIKKEYYLIDSDIEIAIKYFSDNLKENPLNPNSKPLFNNEIMEIRKNYTEADLKNIKRYD